MPTASPRPRSGLDEQGVLTLDSLGILATYGANEAAGPEAILQKPIDATFLGEDVLVLDASAPWVRRFDLDGRLVAAYARNGGGPGEATQPYALAPAEGGFLLSHTRGIERFDAAGAIVASLRNDPSRTGVAECEGSLLATSELLGEGFITTRILTRIAVDGTVLDTLAVHLPARHSTRLMFTWFADARDGTLLYYTEEEARPRLERRSCSGELAAELALDSIGVGLVMRAEGSMMVISTARPPHPSGLARVLDRTLWATRRITAESDSVTMIEAFDPAGAKRRLALGGWYQLFDADAEGRLLLGNTWTLGFNWE